MGYNSLALSDIWQLVLLCAVIFIPMGYWLKNILLNAYAFYYFFHRPSNLKAVGKLKDLKKKRSSGKTDRKGS